MEQISQRSMWILKNLLSPFKVENNISIYFDNFYNNFCIFFSQKKLKPPDFFICFHYQVGLSVCKCAQVCVSVRKCV